MTFIVIILHSSELRLQVVMIYKAGVVIELLRRNTRSKWTCSTTMESAMDLSQ